jgi:RAB protein geranylgeranyltransferase component A
MKFRGKEFYSFSSIINSFLSRINKTGEYDVIVMGTGYKECILSALLSTKGKKVL